MKIHHEGNNTILFVLVLAVIGVLAVFYWTKLFYPTVITATLLGIVWLIVVYFFRVPHYKFENNYQLIFSPANGKVVEIKKVVETEFIKKECWQISIFMSPLNVHLNLYPISGKVVYSKYHPGKYLVAWAPKSSEVNERHSIVLEHSNGSQILVKQIAGFLARRIVNYAKVGEDVHQHAELGFIKFGSRVDVFLPLNAKVNVKLEQLTIQGKTIIATYE